MSMQSEVWVRDYCSPVTGRMGWGRDLFQRYTNTRLCLKSFREGMSGACVCVRVCVCVCMHACVCVCVCTNNSVDGYVRAHTMYIYVAHCVGC